MLRSVVAFSGFKAIHKHQLINPYLSIAKQLSIIIPILHRGKLRHLKVKNPAPGDRKDTLSVSWAADFQLLHPGAKNSP